MPFQNIQVIFTLAMNNNLFEFLGIFNYDSGIFIMHSCKGFAQFLIVRLAFCLDCGPVFGLRVNYGLKFKGFSGTVSV
jgi:hypothetical protein